MANNLVVYSFSVRMRVCVGLCRMQPTVHIFNWVRGELIVKDMNVDLTREWMGLVGSLGGWVGVAEVPHVCAYVCRFCLATVTVTF